MAKRRKAFPQGTEPGFNVFSDADPVEPQIADISSIIHPADDEIELTGEEVGIARTGYSPDGSTTGSIPVLVTDQYGTPMPGQQVRFNLSYVRPGGNWRSASGMKSLYNQNNGNGLKAERLVNQGVIRVLGTLSASSATTGSDGVATVTYRTSHIASDFSQNNRAREKIVATLSNGKQRTLNLNIGWRGLQQIDNDPGGLRIIGARGTRVHPKLRKFLKTLGDAVKGANWPHPVTVTAASLRWGGQYPPHFTHKKGLTLDLRPMSTDGESTWAKKDGSSASNYDLKRTARLIRVLKDSGGTVYFNGQGAGGRPKSGHHNHIHVTWISPNISLATRLGNMVA